MDKPVALLLRTSTILISADQTDAVYHSMDDVPEPLREMLLQSTSSVNSGTILIADRRGKEHISRSVRDLPAALQRGFATKQPREISPATRISTTGAKIVFGWPLIYWAGLLMALLTGILAWLISEKRW